MQISYRIGLQFKTVSDPRFVQYLRDMMRGRGKLHLLDNDRYGVRA